jgi:hypothetical protein
MSQGLYEITVDATVPDAIFDAAPQRAAGKRKARAPKPRAERDAVADVINYIQSLPHSHARKVHGGTHSQVGEPDVDACVDGRAVKLEGKTGYHKPTAVQRQALVRWADAGALAGWFRSVDDVRDLLAHVNDRRFVVDLSQPGCDCPLHAERVS